MGYNTQFSGELTVTNILSMSERDHLSSLLESNDTETYVDLISSYRPELNRYQLCFNDAEKSSLSEVEINRLINEMNTEYPDLDFSLEGTIQAQGEGIGDLWFIKMVDGVAIRIDGLEKDATCPECSCKFRA